MVCIPQHRFVEMGNRVEVVGRREVDLIEAVDHHAKQMAGEHPVAGLLEDPSQGSAGIVASRPFQVSEVRH